MSKNKLKTSFSVNDWKSSKTLRRLKRNARCTLISGWGELRLSSFQSEKKLVSRSARSQSWLCSLSCVPLIYTSELILCSTICVHSATRHNIYMYPCFLFAAIHHLNRPRLSLSDLLAQSAETVHLIRRSWVRFPPRSKEFFLYLVWFPDSLY